LGRRNTGPAAEMRAPGLRAIQRTPSRNANTSTFDEATGVPRRIVAYAHSAGAFGKARPRNSAVTSRQPRHTTVFHVSARCLHRVDAWRIRWRFTGESTRGLRAPIRCLPNRRTNSAPHDGGCTLGLSARCGRDIRISVGRAIRLAQHTRRSSSLARLAAAVAITWRHRVIQETRLNLTCANYLNAAQKFTAQDAPEC
jgi:hypothetical protein